MDWSSFQEEQDALQANSRWRQLRPVEQTTDGYLWQHGRRLLNVASNDYLALRRPFDESLLAEAASLMEADGTCPMTGAGASRLVVGHDLFLDRFEQRFALFKGKEHVLAMPSGYAANVGLMQALAGRGDEVFADRYIHASLYDGIQLSRAKLHRYGHLDLDQLESLLKKSTMNAPEAAAHGPSAPVGTSADGIRAKHPKRRWIVTDAVFSMDGTVAPLHELVALSERYGAGLIVDEAHAGGLYGEQGQGLVHELGLTDRVAVIMGTFSKAYGAYGAYVAADRVLTDQLIQQARSLIYSTGLPNVIWGTVAVQWQKVREERWRAEKVMRVAQKFAETARGAGLSLGRWGEAMADVISPITPVMIGSDQAALKISEAMQLAGIAAVAIRPPTVPEGQARIRFSWSAAHTETQAELVAQLLAEVIGNN